jgi:hypothetical protein
MSTIYILDATAVRPPVRPSSSSVEPSTAETSQRDIKTFAKFFLISVAAVIAVVAAISIRIDNPSTNDRGCTFSANPHNSHLRQGVPPLAIERDWHTDGPPILRWPIDTDWIATSYCDQRLSGRSVVRQIQH